MNFTESLPQRSLLQDAIAATGAVIALESICGRLYDVPGGPRDLTEAQLVDYVAKLRR